MYSITITSSRPQKRWRVFGAADVRRYASMQLLPKIWVANLAKHDRESFTRELESLSRRSFVEIAQQPEYQELADTLNETKRALSVYRDAQPDGSYKVVLQNYRHRFLGYGYMIADGFLFSPDGNVRRLREDELWDYM